MTTVSAWIYSKKVDSWFILSPPFIITAIVFLFRKQLEAIGEVEPWMWFLLIIAVDVGHVYSTVFRTYLDREELQKRPALYILTPLLSFIGGCLLYSFGSLVFWRVIAYVAVFHFVRQQYGFMMIYARHERNHTPSWMQSIDKAVIYLATLYPLVYWHSHERSFDWFVMHDFVKVTIPHLVQTIGILYGSVLGVYVVKEAILWYRNKTINIAKHLLLLGTVVSWYVGIVALNNDIAFSATNVIAHGIPYMALIWIYGHNQSKHQHMATSYVWPKLRHLFQLKMLPLFLLCLIFVAYLEETLWDVLVWRDHPTLFGTLYTVPEELMSGALVWIVPLLAVPQLTHYVLDAFIWRSNTSQAEWKHILFYQAERRR